MPNNDRGPNPKDTVAILDLLIALKLLSEAEFKSKHHLGGSISGFRSYCLEHKSFHRNGRNREIHEWLQMKLRAHQGRSL